MSDHSPITLIRVAVRIENGKPVFDPPQGKHGYQFSKKTLRGVLVFTLLSDDARFCGCSFHPKRGGMPGVEARWGAACREGTELVATFDFPRGALHEGDLHLLYMLHGGKDVLVIDPQVGNDGQTGGGHH